MERQASCHCGQLTLICSGEPAKVSLCHCLDCQRRTGSLFSVAAFFSRARVAFGDGKSARYRRESASGFTVTFHFCPACGSSLWWEPERMPHLIGVAAGAFADPAFPMPEQAVWASNQHEWIAFPDELPTHAENPVRPNPGA